MIHSVFKGNYSLQVFLEEFKYIINEKKVIRYIIGEPSIFSDDSDQKILKKKLKNKNYLSTKKITLTCRKVKADWCFFQINI